MTRLALVAGWLCGGVLVGCGGGGSTTVDAMVDAGQGDGAALDGAPADAAPADAAVVDAAAVDATLPVDAAPLAMGLDATMGPVTYGARTDVTTAPNTIRVRMSDVSGDGKLDVVVANNLGGVGVLVNTTANGATTPTFAALAEQTLCGRPVGLVVADFNADGKPDIAASCPNDDLLTVLLNTTTGPSATSFAGHVDFAAPGRMYELVGADFNADGKPDLAGIANSSGLALVLLNTTAASATTPTFAAHVDFDMGNVGLTALASADVDRDGKPDLVSRGGAPGNHGIRVLINQTAAQAATPAFAARVDLNAPYTYDNYLTMGDLNGDSAPDLLTAMDNPNALGIRLNTTAVGAAPSFATEVQMASGVGLNVSLADLDLDGRLDVIETGQPGNGGPGPGGISIFFNRTPASATTPTLLGPFNYVTGSHAQHVAAGDLNSDGKPDLAVACAPSGGSGFVTVYLAQ